MEIEAVIQYGCPNWTPIFFIEGNGLKEMEALKKDLGSVLALYPTPLVLVGAMVDGKPNWVLAGHVGIMGHDHILGMPGYTYLRTGETIAKCMSLNAK